MGVKKALIDLEELKHLYLSERLSTYQISEKMGISSATAGRYVREMGIVRSHRDATRIQMRRERQIYFTCRLCREERPLSELVEDKRYFPRIYGCKKCLG